MTILNKYWKTIIENYFLFLCNILIKNKRTYSHPICKPAKININARTPTSIPQDLYVQHVRKQDIVLLGQIYLQIVINMSINDYILVLDACVWQSSQKLNKSLKSKIFPEEVKTSSHVGRQNKNQHHDCFISFYVTPFNCTL